MYPSLHLTCRYSIDKTNVSCMVDWQKPDIGYYSYISAVSATCFILPYTIVIVTSLKTWVAWTPVSTGIYKMADRDHNLVFKPIIHIPFILARYNPLSIEKGYI